MSNILVKEFEDLKDDGWNIILGEIELIKDNMTMIIDLENGIIDFEKDSNIGIKVLSFDEFNILYKVIDKFNMKFDLKSGCKYNWVIVFRNNEKCILKKECKNEIKKITINFKSKILHMECYVKDSKDNRVNGISELFIEDIKYVSTILNK